MEHIDTATEGLPGSDGLPPLAEVVEEILDEYEQKCECWWGLAAMKRIREELEIRKSTPCWIEVPEELLVCLEEAEENQRLNEQLDVRPPSRPPRED